MTVYDTYVAALQHGTADVPDAAVKVGVVRKPTRWFYPQVDENFPALGPPEALLEEFQAHRDVLAEDLSDAAAHNQAWDELEFDRRYLEYLDTSPEARDAFEDVVRLLAAEGAVVLVCFENTDEKRCHRTLLVDRLRTATA